MTRQQAIFVGVLLALGILIYVVFRLTSPDHNEVIGTELGELQRLDVRSTPSAVSAQLLELDHGAPELYFEPSADLSGPLEFDCDSVSSWLQTADLLDIETQFYAGIAIEIAVVDNGEKTPLGIYPLISINRQGGAGSTCSPEDERDGLPSRQLPTRDGRELEITIRHYVFRGADASNLASQIARLRTLDITEQRGLFQNSNGGTATHITTLEPTPGGMDQAVICLGFSAVGDTREPWADPCPEGDFAIRLSLDYDRSRLIPDAIPEPVLTPFGTPCLGQTVNGICPNGLARDVISYSATARNQVGRVRASTPVSPRLETLLDRNGDQPPQWAALSEVFQLARELGKDDDAEWETFDWARFDGALERIESWFLFEAELTADDALVATYAVAQSSSMGVGRDRTSAIAERQVSGWFATAGDRSLEALLGLQCRSIIPGARCENRPGIAPQFITPQSEDDGTDPITTGGDQSDGATTTKTDTDDVTVDGASVDPISVANGSNCPQLASNLIPSTDRLPKGASLEELITDIANVTRRRLSASMHSDGDLTDNCGLAPEFTVAVQNAELLPARTINSLARRNSSPEHVFTEAGAADVLRTLSVSRAFCVHAPDLQLIDTYGDFTELSMILTTALNVETDFWMAPLEERHFDGLWYVRGDAEPGYNPTRRDMYVALPVVVRFSLRDSNVRDNLVLHSVTLRSPPHPGVPAYWPNRSFSRLPKSCIEVRDHRPELGQLASRQSRLPARSIN